MSTSLIAALVPRPADIGDVLGDAAGNVLRRIAAGFIDAATWLMQITLNDLNGGLRIDLAAGWIQTVLDTMRRLVIFLIGLLFAVQIITAMLRRDPRGLWRAVWGTALAVLGGAAAAALAAAILLAVDQLTDAILNPGLAAAENGMGVVFGMDGAIDAAGWLVVIIVAGLACLAFLAIHLVLLGRNALIIATVVFAPFAFAGGITDRTRGWIGGWAELLIALAVSKFVIATILTLGFTALDASVEAPAGGSTAQVIVGSLWLLLAAFSPLATMKAVHFAGGELAAHHATGTAGAIGNARSATRSATGVAATGLGAIRTGLHTATATPSAATRPAPPAAASPAGATNATPAPNPNPAAAAGSPRTAQPPPSPPPRSTAAGSGRGGAAP